MILVIGDCVFLTTENYTPFKMDSNHELDPDCSHVFGDGLTEYILTSNDGMVYCYYECKKCTGMIYHLVGERLRPNQDDIIQLQKMVIKK